MRGTNGPMDVITRSEFDDSMKNLLTKDDLSGFVLAVRETLKENLGDLKVDLTAQIDEKVKRSHSLIELHAVTRSDLKDAKNEILATTRRNIADATAPLATKAEMVKVFDGIAKGFDGVAKGFEGVDKGFDGVALAFLKVESRLDAMEHKINTIVMDGFNSLNQTMTAFTAEMRDVVKKHERMLDRHDADLYKLRQSGVLQ
jgi:hypothetical protein